MKEFEVICKMSQPEVKKCMEEYLSHYNYEIINEDGYLYAIPKKNKIPVLLVAHMDTVHKEQCVTIINNKGKLSSPQGIGGDDRCGIYMIAQIVKELPCSVLLTEDEEIGGIGAHKFAKTEHIHNLDVNYMIEFDRKNSCDTVYYNCDNKDFKNFVHDATGMKEAIGSYSDISTLMPAAKIAGVNLSCGYYNPHTVSEYVVFDEMEDVIESAKNLIKEPCEGPFEYIAKTWSKKDWDVPSGHQMSFFDTYKPNPIAETELEFEVVWNDKKDGEWSDIIYGQTKMECWFNFFMEHPDVCVDMIVDYSWC